MASLKAGGSSGGHFDTVSPQDASVVEARRRETFKGQLAGLHQQMKSGALSLDNVIESAAVLLREHVKGRILPMGYSRLMEEAVHMGIALNRIFEANDDTEFQVRFEREWRHEWDGP